MDGPQPFGSRLRPRPGPSKSRHRHSGMATDAHHDMIDDSCGRRSSPSGEEVNRPDPEDSAPGSERAPRTTAGYR